MASTNTRSVLFIWYLKDPVHSTSPQRALAHSSLCTPLQYLIWLGTFVSVLSEWAHLKSCGVTQHIFYPAFFFFSKPTSQTWTRNRKDWHKVLSLELEESKWFRKQCPKKKKVGINRRRKTNNDRESKQEDTPYEYLRHKTCYPWLAFMGSLQYFKWKAVVLHPQSFSTISIQCLW